MPRGKKKALSADALKGQAVFSVEKEDSDDNLALEIASDSDDEIFAKRQKTKRRATTPREDAKPKKRVQFDISPKRRKLTPKFLEIKATSTKGADSEGEGSFGPGVPWVVKYAPATTVQVAVHSKKVKETRTALERLWDVHDPARLLVMSGPSGSSKTALVTALGRELGFKIVEYQTAPDRLEDVSLPRAFGEFLGGLHATPEKTLVLVEDLPNVWHFETKSEFNQALRRWIHSPLTRLPCLVLIVTEVDVPNTDNSYYADESIVVERILTRKLLEDPRVIRVKVPSVNVSLLTKTLKTAVQSEADEFKAIPKAAIDKAIKTFAAYGDVRSALNSLEFWARWWPRRDKKANGRASTDKETTIVDVLGRESHLNLFHAVGKIVHGSSKTDDVQAVEDVLNDWAEANRDGASLNLTILENYASSQGQRADAETIANSAEWLSCSDELLRAGLWRDGSDVACRGVRFTLANARLRPGARNTYRPLVFNREWKVSRKRTEVLFDYQKYCNHHTERLGRVIPPKEAVLYDAYYEYAVANSPRYRSSRTSLWTRRAGGRIGSDAVTPDETDLNDLDVTTAPASPKKEDYGLMFSDDEIIDSP